MVMARAVAQKCSRQLWTEVRKLGDCKSNLANCIDKKTYSESIADFFSEKYRDLCNSVSYELEQIATISNDNKSDITMYCMNRTSSIENDNIVHTHCVTHDQVQCTINKI